MGEKRPRVDFTAYEKRPEGGGDHRSSKKSSAKTPRSSSTRRTNFEKELADSKRGGFQGLLQDKSQYHWVQMTFARTNWEIQKGKKLAVKKRSLARPITDSKRSGIKGKEERTTNGLSREKKRHFAPFAGKGATL